MDLFAVARRALDLALFVLVQGQGDVKRLLAFFAIIFVARHGDLRRTPEGGGVLSKRIRLGDGGVKADARAPRAPRPYPMVEMTRRGKTR